MTETAKTEIKALSLSGIEEMLSSMGGEKYRAKQIYRWLHVSLAGSFDEMKNLPRPLREALAGAARVDCLRVEQSLRAADGTEKYALQLADDVLIESVCMPYRFGNTVCVSSQAGCAMGCTFCASAVEGAVRNLTAGEMLDEVYTIERALRARDAHVARVVVMGMGEPLHNYDNLVRFLTRLSDADGFHMSRRHITVSTCGITERMALLARDLPQINLAVSLHAAIQEKRERIMPVAKRYPLNGLVKACKDHAAVTGRQITFEYALMEGFNDTAEDARALKEITDATQGAVNLIPVNPVRGKSFRAPDRTNVLKFKKNLEKKGIHVTIRREMGRDIDGACGQLVRRLLGENHC